MQKKKKPFTNPTHTHVHFFQMPPQVMIIDTPGVRWADPPLHPRAGDRGTNETRELEGEERVGGAGNATRELEDSRKYLERIGLSQCIGLDMVMTVAKIVQPLHTFIVCDCSKPVASPQDSLIEGIVCM